MPSLLCSGNLINTNRLVERETRERWPGNGILVAGGAGVIASRSIELSNWTESAFGEAMGIADRRKPSSEGKLWRLCPFWQSGNGSPSSSSTQNFQQHKIRGRRHVDDTDTRSSPSKVSSVARSFLPTRRRLRLDPANNLYFPCTSSLWFVLFFTLWLLVLVFLICWLLDDSIDFASLGFV